MNRKKYLQYRKNWYNKNKHKARKYYIDNKLKILKQRKDYYIKYKQTILESVRKYRLKRNRNDLIFRITGNLRHRVNQAIKGNNKSTKSLKLIGCSIQNLKNHLELKFTKGMSWSNYGKWHIDHIRPCVSFNLSKSKEQRKCFHYTNLQPLWARDNLVKHTSKKYE